MTILGVDVSVYQNVITDFQMSEIAARGTQFIVCKCGNGNDKPDPNFTSNVQRARNHGITVGCYHFIDCGLPSGPGLPANRDPLKQAAIHFQQCGGLGVQAGDLVAFADAEYPDPSRWGKPLADVQGQPTVTRDMVNEWTLAYLKEYSSLQGRTMGLYSYLFWLKSLAPDPEYAAYPLWLAEYGPTVTPVAPWAGWCAWQTSGGGGKLPNGTPVDTDEIADQNMFDFLRGLRSSP
jgi:GH25 family lysozyme M1 (1,4-beta-N-acetylmuramidase)